jgi:hypothetical protein
MKTKTKSRLFIADHNEQFCLIVRRPGQAPELELVSPSGVELCAYASHINPPDRFEMRGLKLSYKSGKPVLAIGRRVIPTPRLAADMEKWRAERKAEDERYERRKLRAEREARRAAKRKAKAK